MKIRAISHIRHDGKLIEPGKSADVPDSVGKYLIKSGSAEVVKTVNRKPETGNRNHG